MRDAATTRALLTITWPVGAGRAGVGGAVARGRAGAGAGPVSRPGPALGPSGALAVAFGLHCVRLGRSDH